eukprot:1455471-Pyramimonas_sp.AAC.1
MGVDSGVGTMAWGVGTVGMWWKQWDSEVYSGGGDSGEGGAEDGGGTMGQRYSGDIGGDSGDSGGNSETAQWDSGGDSGTVGTVGQ